MIRQAILDFVTVVSAENSATYVQPEERIATFDNDGTLWCERPLSTKCPRLKPMRLEQVIVSSEIVLSQTKRYQ
jgi:hypothetical protein